jgi:hypothetical protein
MKKQVPIISFLTKALQRKKKHFTTLQSPRRKELLTYSWYQVVVIRLTSNKLH